MDRMVRRNRRITETDFVPKIKQHHAGENGWTNPETPVMRGYRMNCCDCGLTHDVNFTAVKVMSHNNNGTWNYKELDVDKYRVVLSMKRNNRSTAQVRRHMPQRAALEEAKDTLNYLADRFNCRGAVVNVIALIDAALTPNAEVSGAGTASAGLPS